MSDARTTLTDAVATLGTIIDMSQKRDAIHLATEPVMAAKKLFPGQDVGLDVDGLASPTVQKMVGIVDPFLKSPVYPGERFWLIVYPRQITTLRHTWEHPDFPAVAEKVLEKLEVVSCIQEPSELQEALKVLEEVANDHGITYAELLADASYSEGEEYFYSAGSYVGGLDEDFWAAYTKVTGKEVTVEGYDDGCRGC